MLRGLSNGLMDIEVDGFAIKFMLDSAKLVDETMEGIFISVLLSESSSEGVGINSLIFRFLPTFLPVKNTNGSQWNVFQGFVSL